MSKSADQGEVKLEGAAEGTHQQADATQSAVPTAESAPEKEDSAPSQAEEGTGDAEDADPEEIVAHAIEVTSVPAQFRRAGRLFTREPVTLLVEELSEAELQLILEEPMLTVVVHEKDA